MENRRSETLIQSRRCDLKTLTSFLSSTRSKMDILGDHEMSREEFSTMARQSMKKEKIEKVEKGLFVPEPEELPQKIP